MGGRRDHYDLSGASGNIALSTKVPALEKPAHSSSDEVLCPECDYNLQGAVGDRCPWCGWTLELEALLHPASDSGNWRRLGVIVAGLVVGLGALFAVFLLAGENRRLSLWDGLAVLGVLVAAAGHLGLAFLAAVRGRRWPLREREAMRLLMFAAVFSLLVGTVGASKYLHSGTQPKMKAGVVVTGFLDFALAAGFYSLPAGTLLILCLVSFRGGSGRLRPDAEKGSSGGDLTSAPFGVVFHARFADGQIIQTWTDRPRSSTPALERCIDQAWESECALAEMSRRVLYNGRLVRLDGVSAVAEALHCDFGPTTYREFLGTHVHHRAEALREGPTYLANPLGISATLITDDGFIAFGRRSPHVAIHAGYLHTFGGMLEEADRRSDGMVDVFEALRRELVEELCLRREELADMFIVGMVQDLALRQPELLFDVSVRVSRSELATRLEAMPQPHEHSGLEFLPDRAEAALPFLALASPVAPIAEAALLLHGYSAWGPVWYAQSCIQRYGGQPPRLQ